MGGLDRVTRAVLAIIFIALYLANVVSGVVGAVLLTIGIILLLTSIAGVCPLYSLFGLSTCKTEQHKHA